MVRSTLRDRAKMQKRPAPNLQEQNFRKSLNTKTVSQIDSTGVSKPRNFKMFHLQNRSRTLNIFRIEGAMVGPKLQLGNRKAQKYQIFGETSHKSVQRLCAYS